ncbi:MAG: DinB family protein [Desulfovibrio sp.]|uniref:DinB family protein n=1 Tax=Desulfovibrio sp. TaxID=885 RepID=UPI00135EF023|nr:DinB family protein [Desulfovibrio sp.]MTJ92104.1 DinB family protein [Desulfovibrio sp.]
MSRAIVAELEGPYQRAWGLMTQFIDVCPEEIWAETNGGWPVWQQVAHAVAVLNFFVLEKDDDTFVSAPAELGVLMLKEQGQQVVSKEAMKAYGAAVMSVVDTRVARLTDADLTRIQERVSKKIGRDLSYGAVMVMLGSHTMYHLGSCDAALRDHGLPGVF